MAPVEYILPFESLSMKDIDKVGGKNASLGEMLSHLTKLGVKVPTGFATTSDAFRRFMSYEGLDKRIESLLESLDVDDITALMEAGKTIRGWLMDAPFEPDFQKAVADAYATLSANSDRSVAVRSSATAEDLPDASFAGQQETILNVRGIDAVLSSLKVVFASLYNDRAIAYRVHQGFSHADVALSAGIQLMVRSDLAASGVMFTLDTESGFDGVVLITGAYGLGELVVQGAINPDEFYVNKQALLDNKASIIRKTRGTKHLRMVYSSEAGQTVKTEKVSDKESLEFSLSDHEIEELARCALKIEKHYGRPMDIEWAKDGLDGKLYIVQARPETVKSQSDGKVMERYSLNETARVVTQGRSIGQKIGSGVAKIIHSLSDINKIQPGDVLVTDMTDPDWEPIMKRASAIVTNRGGRTCHAAIIARELGIPAVVGCNDATHNIQHGGLVTVSCAQGDVGYVYEGQLPFTVKKITLSEMPPLPFKVMMNVGNPDRAFDFQRIPNEGVGLARLEFIISQMIGVHPEACLAYPHLPADVKHAVELKSAGYASPKEFYIQKLVEGISTLSTAFYPKPVIIRFSDFKSNEYANLVGGKLYEPEEENPMIGFRGAARYVSEKFKPCFELELEAIKRVRGAMGLTNTQVMIPFVRTTQEAKSVLDIMAANGLARGKDGLKVMMMCELPTNALLAEDYLEYFDGFSIGSNDLTQLTLGLDRDSSLVAGSFDERDAAVKMLISMAIKACLKHNKYIGICGQGPSDHPDLAAWLMESKIESISLNPDTVVQTWLSLGKK